MKFDAFEFAQPWWLLGLLLIPLLMWLLGGSGPVPAVRFSSIEHLSRLGRVRRAAWGGWRWLLLLAGLVLSVAALAQPRLGKQSDAIQSSGVDIMLTIDVSGSMFAEDFTLGGERVNRLDAVKDVAARFIKGRPNDRIGMVAFAGRPYLVSPLTLDHAWLMKNLERVRIGLVEDGTAIGDAIASAGNRLKDKKAKSKIIVLLTDGDQTAGQLTPTTAAEAAKALGIKIYSIAAGTKGSAPIPMMDRNLRPIRDLFGNKQYRTAAVTVDEATLTKVAEIAGGKFFRATDTESLQAIFEQIDALEKTEVTLQRRVDWLELHPKLTAAGTLLAAMHLLLSLTRWRCLP